MLEWDEDLHRLIANFAMTHRIKKREIVAFLMCYLVNQMVMEEVPEERMRKALEQMMQQFVEQKNSESLDE